MNSILHEIQREQGAAFRQEADHPVASVFSDVNEEYATVNSAVGLADRTHYSRLQLRGKDGLDFYHRMTTQDMKNLEPGIGKQTTLTNEKGRIIDVHIVLPGAESTWILANPGSGERSIRWLKKFVFIDDVKLTDWTEGSVQFSLLGTGAENFLSDLIRQDVAGWKSFQFIHFPFEGEDLMILKNQSLGRLPVFDLLATVDRGEKLWKFLVEKGSTYGLLPVGSITTEILRVESGVPAAGAEWNEDFNPLETKLTETISWTKGCYIGQEVIARLYNYEKISKELVGFRFGSHPIAPGSAVLKDGREIGKVTSRVFSIGLDQNIGLGIVRIPENQPGNRVAIHSQSGEIEAEVCGLPFI